MFRHNFTERMAFRLTDIELTVETSMKVALAVASDEVCRYSE